MFRSPSHPMLLSALFSSGIQVSSSGFYFAGMYELHEIFSQFKYVLLFFFKKISDNTGGVCDTFTSLLWSCVNSRQGLFSGNIYYFVCFVFFCQRILFFKALQKFAFIVYVLYFLMKTKLFVF